MDARIISLISYLGPYMTGSQNQDLTNIGRQIEYMQSQIDALMLEYCPDEMSKEQLDNWASHQIPVKE